MTSLSGFVIRVMVASTTDVPNWQRVHQDCVLLPCIFNLYAQYIMWNAGLDETQAGIKIARRNINNHRYADDTISWHHFTYGRKQRRTLEPLDESERKEWKIWLKIQHSKHKDHGIWSHYFMANRWGNNRDSDRIYFWKSLNSLQMVTAAMKLKDFCFL